MTHSMTKSRSIRTGLTLMTLSVCILGTSETVFAGDLNSICLPQVNETLQFMGKPALNEDGYIVKTRQGKWVKLSDFNSAEQTEIDKKDAADDISSARVLLRNWSIQQTKLGGDPSAASINPRLETNRYSGEPDKSGQSALDFIRDARGGELVETLKYISDRSIQCRIHPDSHYVTALREITAARQKCTKITCSSDILADLKTSEETLTRNRETAMNNRLDCRQAELNYETMRRSARIVIDKMMREATRIVPMSEFLIAEKDKKRSDCIVRYQSTEEARQTETLNARLEEMKAVCRTMVNHSPSCSSEMNEVRAQLKRINVYEICGYQENERRDTTNVKVFTSGGIKVSGSRQTATNSLSMDFDLRASSCDFVGEGKYDHSNNKYRPNEFFKTPLELQRFENGCSRINRFSDRPAQCGNLAEPAVAK